MEMPLKSQDISAIAIFAALVVIGGMISMPIPSIEVPFTLQLFFVLLAGALLGAKRGALSLLVWMMLRLFGIGVPVGASIGPAAILGPTGGYILGFPLGAFLTGLVLEKLESPSTQRVFIAMLLGTLVIYLSEIVHQFLLLQLLAGSSALEALRTAVLLMVMPFVAVDLLKVFVASHIATSKRLLEVRRRFL